MEFDEPPTLLVLCQNTSAGVSAYYNNTNDKKGGYGASITKNSNTNFTFKDNSGAGGGCTVLYV